MAKYFNPGGNGFEEEYRSSGYNRYSVKEQRQYIRHYEQEERLSNEQIKRNIKAFRGYAKDLKNDVDVLQIYWNRLKFFCDNYNDLCFKHGKDRVDNVISTINELRQRNRNKFTNLRNKKRNENTKS